jgi:hypothetical protein
VHAGCSRCAWLSQARRERLPSGSTACVAIIKEKTLYVANLGDSRAVLCCARKAVPLSADHNTSSKAEQDRVIADGGFLASDGEDLRVGGELSVTRSFGDYGRVEKVRGLSADPDIREHSLTEDDEFLLIACDGLWDEFTNQSAVGAPFSSCCPAHHKMPAVNSVPAQYYCLVALCSALFSQNGCPNHRFRATSVGTQSTASTGVRGPGRGGAQAR